MSTADYDVIKEIPGYKVILKAVLKSQIQQLVEQLAVSTDEESVILTASVADGTLSHLGSESGKGFLEDHEDIKSQFLGFCLKTHHKKKLEKERQAAELERQAAELIQQRAQTSPGRYSGHRGAYTARQPRFSSGIQGSVHPVALMRASPGAQIRSPGVRHEPYSVTRPPKRTSLNFDTSRNPPSGPSASPAQVIKIEAREDDESSNQNESETLKQDTPRVSDPFPSQQSNPPLSVQSESGDKGDDSVSDSSISNIPNEPFSEGLSVDSDASSMISDNVQKQNSESSEIDPNVSVKLEAINESEMDLEITGVEPGRPSISQDSWDPNMPLAMNYDTTGATGNQGDMSNQGYSLDMNDALNDALYAVDQSDLADSEPGDIGHQTESKELQNFSDFYVTNKVNGFTVHGCAIPGCGRMFKVKRAMMRHIRTHTKERPFACRYCNYKCARKDNLRVHEFKHTPLQ